MLFSFCNRFIDLPDRVKNKNIVIKKTLVNSYGTAADPATADFMRTVNDIHK